jgi:hypothetical protein
MEVIEFGMVSDVNDEHPEKQLILIYVIEFGMVNDVTDEHP